MNPLALNLSQYMSKLSVSLFAGNAMYCSLVEHPARLECGTRLAATVFPPSFKRAAVIQGALAAVGAISSTAVYFGVERNRDPKWLAVGALMFSILPYTYFVLMPINWRLLDPKCDRDADETKTLMHQWGVRHAFRTIVGLIATALVLHS